MSDSDLIVIELTRDELLTISDLLGWEICKGNNLSMSGSGKMTDLMAKIDKSIFIEHESMVRTQRCANDTAGVEE